jgi:hypothetical protein
MVTESIQGVRNFDPGGVLYHALAESASPIAGLLDTPKVGADKGVKDCLDLLLGAVYSLVFATQEKFEHRVGRPVEDDKVLIRARDLKAGTVRMDGKWIAGFHLNSALFRVSCVYDRILSLLSQRPTLDERRKDAETRYGWREHDKTRAIRGQVNKFKHSTSGTYVRRHQNADLSNSSLLSVSC